MVDVNTNHHTTKHNPLNLAWQCHALNPAWWCNALCFAADLWSSIAVFGFGCHLFSWQGNLTP
jgi:hypothetical protein